MFWSSVVSYSAISELLDQPDLTIEQLLDEENILQICHEKDKRLLDFLSREENIDYLVDSVRVCRPVSESVDTSLYRYPNLACEILTSDIACLLDGILKTNIENPSHPTEAAISDFSEKADGLTHDDKYVVITSSPIPECGSFEQKHHIGDTGASALNCTGKSESAPSLCRPRLDRLLSAVPTCANPLTASFVSRVLTHLALQRGSIVIPYMRSSPNFMEHILNRLDMAAMADLILQLAQQDRGQQGLVLEWFTQEQLISRLIERFDSNQPIEVHQSVGYCLIQLLSTLRSILAYHSPTQPTFGQTESDSNPASDTGLPPTSPYATSMFMNGDEALSRAAIRLLDVLESEETIKSLFERLTSNQATCPSIGSQCIAVLMALIDKKKESENASTCLAGAQQLDQWLRGGGFYGALNSSSPFGSSNQANTKTLDKLRLPKTHVTLVSASIPFIARLHAMLQQTPQQQCGRVSTTFGPLDPPLGRFRLSLVQFFAQWIDLSKDAAVPKAIMADNLIKTFMDLFETYRFNTLLHQAVTSFILSIFTHCKALTQTNGKTRSEADRHSADTERVVHTDSDPNQSSSHDDSMEVDGPEAGMKPTANFDAENSSAWDELLSSVFVDHRLTDWLLRLCPLPEDYSSLPATNLVWKTRSHPKPGYTGHLWRLANMIEDMRSGPRSTFVEQVFNKLPEESVSAWGTFVYSALTKIEKLQKADPIPTQSSQAQNSFSQILSHHEIGSLLSQSAGFVNFSAASGTGGKFSLFLSPLDLDSRSTFLSALRSTDLDNNDPVSDSSPPNKPTHSSLSHLFNVSHDDDDDEEEEIASSTPRMATMSSDGNSESDGEPEEPEEDASSDVDLEADEEEDLCSPVVIKQQRTNSVPRTKPIIGLSEYASDPWNDSNNDSSAVLNDSNSPPNWAQFDDGAAQSNDNATDWPMQSTVASVSDNKQTQSLNGVQHTAEPKDTSDPPAPDLNSEIQSDSPKSPVAAPNKSS